MVLARRPPASDFDLALVLRARSGDPDAFTQLMDEYGATVRRLVSRFVQDADDARDVEQETWIRAASRLETLQEPGRFRPWVKSIARHASLNFIASRKRRRARVSTFEDCGTEDFEDAQAETPERHVLSRDSQRKVWEALGGLSERDRTALYLREYRDLPYTEIAERLGISRSAAEVCVFRARERFRHLFAAVEDRTITCGIDPLRLSVLVDGDVDAGTRATLMAHIRACADCEERLTTMQAGQALYRNLPAFGIPIGLSTGALSMLGTSVGALVSKALGALGIGGGGTAAATGTTVAGTAAATTTGVATTAAAAGGASILAPVIAGAAAVVISAGAVTGGMSAFHDPGPMLPPSDVAAVAPTEAPESSGVASTASASSTSDVVTFPGWKRASVRGSGPGTGSEPLTVAIVDDAPIALASGQSTPGASTAAEYDHAAHAAANASTTVSTTAAGPTSTGSQAASTAGGAGGANAQPQLLVVAANHQPSAADAKAAKQDKQEAAKAAKEEAKAAEKAAKEEAKAAKEEAKAVEKAAKEEAKAAEKAAKEEAKAAKEEAKAVEKAAKEEAKAAKEEAKAAEKAAKEEAKAAKEEAKAAEKAAKEEAKAEREAEREARQAEREERRGDRRD